MINMVVVNSICRIFSTILDNTSQYLFLKLTSYMRSGLRQNHRGQFFMKTNIEKRRKCCYILCKKFEHLYSFVFSIWWVNLNIFELFGSITMGPYTIPTFTQRHSVIIYRYLLKWSYIWPLWSFPVTALVLTHHFRAFVDWQRLTRFDGKFLPRLCYSSSGLSQSNTFGPR